MLAGRQPSTVVDVSRAVGLFPQSGGPLSMYPELSHACSFPFWPFGLIPVRLEPPSDSVPHDLALGDLLGLAGCLQIARHRRVEVEAVQELASHCL